MADAVSPSERNATPKEHDSTRELKERTLARKWMN